MHHLQHPAHGLGLVPSACIYAIPSPWNAPSQLPYGANSYTIYKSQIYTISSEKPPALPQPPSSCMVSYNSQDEIESRGEAE